MDDVLKDVDRNGKERPWRDRKAENILYSEYLEILKFKKAFNVRDCGNVLTFAKTANGLKLYQTWFCHSRLCPLCSWRRSKKNSAELIQILSLANKKYPTAQFLFLTLTEENASPDGLKDAIKMMNGSIRRLFQYKKVKQNLLGYVRSTEITYNENLNSYHQHVHVLLMVNPGYFKGGSYLSQKEWSKFWQKARKLDYLPVVNVKKVRPNQKKGTYSLVAAATETAKYQVKSKDYLVGKAERDLEVVETLEQALANTRALSFAGVLKEIRHDLKFDTKENEDNLIGENGVPEPGSGVISLVYQWNNLVGNYLFKSSSKA